MMVEKTEAVVPAVRVEKLVKDFAVPFRREKLRAVAGISLEMAPGEVYGLIGPNGSGKSTTMKILLGLISPTAGRTEIFGVSSRKVSSRRAVGYLPESPYFYKHLTGAETLRFYGRLCGLRGGDLKGRIGEMLELVALEDASDRRLGGYSKGMLQRIGLAQALIQEPRLVVLDEPTAGVDPAGSRKIRDLVLEMKARGISVILCSHLLEQVQEVCDRVGIIHRGRLVCEGALEDLINIEEQTDIVLENASPELLAEIRARVEGSEARVVRMGHPRTTLERLFLRETSGEAGGARGEGQGARGKGMGEGKGEGKGEGGGGE